MQLTKQDLVGLFAGVSRQAPEVRLPGQLQEAENVTPSLLTGGFMKRAGTSLEAVLDATNGAPAPVQVYFYERDEAEAYVVLFYADNIRVFGLDGSEKTVTLSSGTAAYLAGTGEGRFRVLTIGDTTIVANSQIAMAMAAVSDSRTLAGTRQSFSDLPTSGVTVGQIYKVVSTPDATNGAFYVEATGASPNENWVETVAIGEPTQFNLTTMPHRLIRNSNGTFTFSTIPWVVKTVGDATTVPTPEIIGNAPSDLAFFRSRLMIQAGEYQWFTSVDDLFRFWPLRTTQVIDSDPFGRLAPTEQVNRLSWAVPYRKRLFATSALQQFETTSDTLFGPRTAAIDPTTRYSASRRCKPVVLGETLYFAAETAQTSQVYEYYFDDVALTDTADEVTRHASGYIDAELVQMIPDAVHGGLYCLAEAAAGSILWVYRTYHDGDTKRQSAWVKWRLTGRPMGGAVIRGYLYLVIRQGTLLTLERLYLGHEARPDAGSALPLPDGRKFAVHLDRRKTLTGTYDAGTNLTTFTLPYPHEDRAVLIRSTAFTEGVGAALRGTYHGTHDIRVTGNVAGLSVIAGLPFTMRALLSELFLRDPEDNKAVLNGDFVVSRLSIRTRETGDFQVLVEVPGRPDQETSSEGRIIGSPANVLGVPAITKRRDTRVTVAAREPSITILSSSHLPVSVVSIRVEGEYTEISQ